MSALGSVEVTAAPSTVKGLPRYEQTPAAPVAGREEGGAGEWEGVRDSGRVRRGTRRRQEKKKSGGGGRCGRRRARAPRAASNLNK